MSESIEYIDHNGRVTALDTAKRTVTVTFIDHADCGGCPAGKLCDNFDPEKNIVVIPVPDARKYEVGDFVTVRGTERLHRKAIMIATVIPSIALVAVMIGIYLLTDNQLAACLSGLGAMLVFFLGLYLMRNRIAHEFSFQVIKLPSEPAVKAEEFPGNDGSSPKEEKAEGEEK